MSWRDVVTNWLSNKKDLTLLDLLQEMIQADMIRDMIEANMIPATLIDNQTLHSILLTQVILETLMDLSVPPANNFTHNANRRIFYLLYERQGDGNVGLERKEC